ncbi:MAG: hypothetical protein EA400_04625 [Chromatiaceae bacterium]|nr:MAG: hypothetical protein EA400_04625 [Chromatiaceae bacterium]
MSFPSRPVLLLLAWLTLTGCTGTVSVPDSAADQRPVFLLAHGRHTSLVLTRADGSLVRYAYGDWRWYADGDTGALRAVPTLFVATRGALGRQTLSGPASRAALAARLHLDPARIHRLTAPATRIDRLVAELDATFAAAGEQRRYNPAFGLEFVPDPQGYSLFANSNHRVMDWLHALGIEARGNPMFGHWQIRRGNAG